jgi:hypothetical protein
MKAAMFELGTLKTAADGTDDGTLVYETITADVPVMLITRYGGMLPASDPAMTTGELHDGGTTTVDGTEAHCDDGTATTKVLGTVTIKFDGTNDGTTE